MDDTKRNMESWRCCDTLTILAQEVGVSDTDSRGHGQVSRIPEGESRPVIDSTDGLVESLEGS